MNLRSEEDTNQEVDVLQMPTELKCPITIELMMDPVVAADGFAYERSAITRWLLAKGTSPVTNLQMPSMKLYTSHTLRSLIDSWITKNPRWHVENPEWLAEQVRENPRHTSARSRQIAHKFRMTSKRPNGFIH